MARPRVNFVHPLLRARDYQNRPEFDRLCDWWRRGGQGVCALVGIGGAGKTAVADHFLRVLPGSMADDPNLPKDDTLPAPGALFVFSFYKASNPDEFKLRVQGIQTSSDQAAHEMEEAMATADKDGASGGDDSSYDFLDR